jgi:hypothetical protein
MRRLLAAMALALVCLAGSPCLAAGGAPVPGARTGADEAGYVPLDAGSRNAVDGRRQLVAAYAVILGMISAYAALLLVRGRTASSDLERLEKRLGPLK